MGNRSAVALRERALEPLTVPCDPILALQIFGVLNLARMPLFLFIYLYI